MATEIGTAYLQVLPSMKGIQGNILNELGPAAENAGSTAGNKGGAMMGSKFLKAINVAAIGAAVVGGISAAVGQGAALEQSLGGIETLFKGSADTVKKYAAQSFQSVGLSANAYMENVTSFSASMISSLGGNTAKAAELSNQAMVDMSDNANKMGTDLELITQTYQSLARGNYEMLDNLKLGYGGTKTELQRLLSDAEKLSGQHYDIGNFADVTQAIHVIQQNLGITGTTAKEAATTISGSFNMLKASWSDFLGNLALGNDLGPVFQNLITSLVTFASNLVPAIFNIIKGAITGIASIWGTLRDKLASGDFNGIFQSIADKISTTLPVLITQGIPMLIKAIANMGVAVISGLFSLIVSIVAGVFGGLYNTVASIFQNIVNAVSAKMTAAVTTVSNTWQRIKKAISGTLNFVWGKLTAPIEKAWNTIHNIWSKLKKLFPLRIGNIFSNLRLPHISVKGGKAPFGIGGKGHLPSFSVSWYAKGGIFNGPSVIGVGEAGPEAVLPITRLQGMLDNSRIGEQDTLEEIAAMLAYIAQHINDARALSINGREWARMVKAVK